MNIVQNNQRIDALNLQKLSASLSIPKEPKKAKGKVQECSKDCCPENHSEPDSDEVEPAVTSKLVLKKKVESGPTTRSRANTVASIATDTEVVDLNSRQFCKVVDRQSVPPSRPSCNKELQRPRNEGIGSMAAFLAMRERQKLADVENVEENGVDESFMAQTDDHQSIETSRNTTKSNQRKHRGQTRMDIVHTRRHEERKVIMLNDDFQPVSNDGKSTSELSNFLGTLARNYVPLDFTDWRKVPDKDNMWEFVKYIIPEEGKPWVMHTIREAWKAYKCRIKANHYSCYDNDEERLQHKPDDIPLEEFKTLLYYWADEKVQKLAEKNAESRKKITDTHTAGPRSFAQVKWNLQLEKPNKEVPSRAEIFVATRKRTKGRGYKSPTEILSYRISKIQEICSSGANDETVEQLISGDTPHGVSWLVGRRAVPKKSKKKSTKPTENNSDSYVEELTAMIKKQLQGEMDEKMNKKMEEMAQNMNKILKEMAENMNRKMRENLRWMMRKLGEVNALVEVDMEEICGTSSENNNVAVSSKDNAPSDQEME